MYGARGAPLAHTVGVDDGTNTGVDAQEVTKESNAREKAELESQLMLVH